MGVVLCKEDRFAEPAAVVDGQPVGHQGVQHLPDRILIEDPLIQRRGCDALRQLAVFILKGVLVGLLVRVGELVVDDALLDEFQPGLHGQEIHQIPVTDGLRQLVAVGRHAVFQLKDLVGILVDLVLGRGRQTHQRRIEIIENIAVFIVDRAVRLVADHEIEMPAGKELSLLVLRAVDDVVHGLVGRKDAVRGIVILLLTEICDGKVGQQIYKAAFGLRDKTAAVGEKQNVLYPPVPEQHIAQRNDRPRLAGAGRHDQKSLAAVSGKGIADRFDRALLIVPSGNGAVHHGVFQARPHGLEIEQLFQIALGVNGGAPALEV